MKQLVIDLTCPGCGATLHIEASRWSGYRVARSLAEEFLEVHGGGAGRGGDPRVRFLP